MEFDPIKAEGAPRLTREKPHRILPIEGPLARMKNLQQSEAAKAMEDALS
jgi:hypothetical protein